MEFIGREEELGILEKEYARKSSFTVIYGRRRVGKTTLVRRFAENKDSIYFLATEESATENLARFSETVSAKLGFRGMRFARWYDALDAATRGGKKVIVIDEFPYIAASDPSIPSQFQEIWDNLLKDREVMLVICGSFKGMMEKYVLNRTSPLYGRRTATMKIRPLDFATIRRAFPEKDFRQLLEEYGCHGGVPKYMEILEGTDLREGILRNIANRNGVLFEEPLFLLNGETRNPISYITIMNSIAKGNVQLKDIAGRMEVPVNSLTPYLNNLVDMGILERRVPPTEPNPERSRKGIYGFADHFIGFWFRFIYPYKAEIESGHAEEVMRYLDAHYADGYLSFIFEKVCGQITWSLKDRIGIGFTRVGSITGPEEFDVVAVDPENKRAFVAECKYYGKPVTVGVLDKLKEKCSRCKDFRDYTVTYGLYSASGFDKNLADLAETTGDILVDLQTLDFGMH